MKRVIIFFIFLQMLTAVAYGEQVSRIELTDGSIINGEIVSFSNGFYVINTTTFGQIKVEAAKISKIESAKSLSSNSPINSTGQPINLGQSQIDAYKEKLMSDPENLAIVTRLATDPQIQEMAKDPQILDAAKSGDIQALLKNEKFMNMVNSAEMQEAVKKLKQ